LLSSSCPMKVHVSGMGNQMWNSSSSDAETFMCNEVIRPCCVAANSVGATSAQSTMDFAESQIVSGTSDNQGDKYCPGELFVQSAALVDHDERSDCSTADTVGTSTLTYELPNLDKVQTPADSISANAFIPPRMAHVTTSEPYEFTPAQFPTCGSLMHFTGQCKPCAFFNTKGCTSGYECQFCHLCPPGEKKRRKRAKGLHYNYLKQNGLLWAASTATLA